MLSPLSGLGCVRGNRLHLDSCGWGEVGQRQCHQCITRFQRGDGCSEKKLKIRELFVTLV